jgi:hypothetical protein
VLLHEVQKNSKEFATAIKSKILLVATNVIRLFQVKNVLNARFRANFFFKNSVRVSRLTDEKCVAKFVNNSAVQTTPQLKS